MVNQATDIPYRGGFIGGEHRFAVHVYFEDTDAGGIVYHANHLRFMERARSDMLRAIGIDQRAAIDDGTGVYAVAGLSIRYRQPARLGDDLVVSSRVTEVRAASATIAQHILRDGQTVSEAEVVAAFLSRDGRPQRQPRLWIEQFERLMRHDGGEI